MNDCTENFHSTEVHPSTIIQEILIPRGFWICLLGFNILFGVPIHSYVLWLIARERRIPSEIFNVNITVCEIIYSFIFLKQIFPNSQINLELHCFLQGLGITGRPLFHCLMCVERYLAVVHPVTFLKYKPLRYRVICCTAVWVITLGSCLAVIQTSSNLKTYSWFFSIQFLLFFSIQLFCLVAVIRALKQSGPGERGRGGEREEENHMKRRAFHLILITTVTMVVMFVPFVITGFLTVLQQQKQQKLSLIWFLGPFCFILAGFVQPVLYLHRAGKLFCLCSS